MQVIRAQWVAEQMARPRAEILSWYYKLFAEIEVVEYGTDELSEHQLLSRIHDLFISNAGRFPLTPVFGEELEPYLRRQIVALKGSLAEVRLDTEVESGSDLSAACYTLSRRVADAHHWDRDGLRLVGASAPLASSRVRLLPKGSSIE